MTEDDRQLDLLLAELEQESRLMRARNERLEQELAAAHSACLQYRTALERILTVSELALRDGVSQGVSEVGAQSTSAVARSASGLL